MDTEQIENWITSLDTEMLTAYAMDYGTALLGALLIFFFGKWIARAVTRFARRVMQKNDLDPTIVSFVCNIIYTVLFAMVVIAAIGTLGVETTSLAAVIAAAGLAIGLALQGSLSNFAAGVMIIMFRPFKSGDFVEAAGTSGTVEEVGIFNTHLTTVDNRAVIVPNDSILSATIINFSARESRRIDLTIGVSYNDDLGKVKKVLEDIVTKDDRILEEPACTIAVAELGESSVNLVVRPWVKTAEYWDVRFDLIERIKTRFDAEGISIPYPQRDLHIVTAAAGLKAA